MIILLYYRDIMRIIMHNGLSAFNASAYSTAQLSVGFCVIYQKFRTPRRPVIILTQRFLRVESCEN